MRRGACERMEREWKKTILRRTRSAEPKAGAGEAGTSGKLSGVAPGGNPQTRRQRYTCKLHFPREASVVQLLLGLSSGLMGCYPVSMLEGRISHLTVKIMHSKIMDTHTVFSMQ